jgi:hypothetical protein
MAMLDFLQKNTNGNFNKTAFRVLTWVVGVLGVFIALSILFPHAVAVLLSIIWVILLVVVIVFFSLGILVIFGLRKEATKILDFLIEGSLSLVDFLAFLKLIWLKFLEIVREFILFATPVIAYIVALIVYTLVLVIYKNYGRTHDVTVFTIILSAAMVFAIGFLNKPSSKTPDLTVWWNKVKKVFHSSFVDGLEVVLFIFFLTMDSTNLFFLPDNLNILLHAKMGDYDFMVRSFVSDGHMGVTVNIIIFTITIEILRNVFKLIASARKHYTNDILLFSDGVIARRTTRVKNAIRKSFQDSKDELVRFITFTTVLFAVFLLFPRLKLLTLAVASVASLIMDLIFTDRMLFTRGNDLISRLLGKIFKL